MTTSIDDGVVDGDGGAAKVSEKELDELKELVEEIGRDVAEYIVGRQQSSAETRFCQWEGQSSDGRKHKVDQGKDVLPFEGASDSRIFTADKIVNEHLREYRLAAARVVPQIMGMESTDAGRGQKLRTLLRYLVMNKWDDYTRQISLVGQYMEGDEPGVGIMGVYWRRERSLKNAMIVPEDLIIIYVQAMQESGQQLDEADVDYLLGLFDDEANADALAALVSTIHPQMESSRVKKVVKELYETGEAEFPEPYIKTNMPVLEAHKLYDDIFIPINTTDIQRARVIIKRNWYSRAEAKERAAIDGWNKSFVDKLVGLDDDDVKGYESMTGFNDEHRGASSDTIVLDEDAKGKYAGLYEVLTAYSREVNKDGVPAIYVRKFSWFVDEPAKDREMQGYLHGKFPFVVFPREYLSKLVLDSRGVPLLVQTPQHSMKLHNDSLEDHVQVNTNPPIKVPPNKPRFQLTLQPFGQIMANPREDISYMDPPRYPVAAEKQRGWVENEVNDYFGRESDKVTPEESMEAQQDRINHFLDCLKQALYMALQLCQQYMTDEEIQRIVGGAGLPLARSVEEIQGQFDIYLSYDVRDMDLEYLKKKAELFMTYVRSLDTRQTVQYEQVVRRIFEAIDPNLAEESLVQPQVADERERNEEKHDIALMLNGLRPERPEKGQNHRLRLQVLEEELALRMQNPEAFEPMSLASRAILKEQLDYRRFQVQQEENADIGRKGYQENNLAALEAGQ